MQRRTLAALVLALASCTTTSSLMQEKAQRTPSLVQQSLPQLKRYRFICTPFEDFNPAPSAREIQLKPLLRVVVEHGLDVLDNRFCDTQTIQEYVAFRDFVYDEAQKLGYASEDIECLSPREAVLLTSNIAASKINYFGRLTDFSARQKRERMLKHMRNDLEAVAQDPSVNEQDKKQTQQKLEVLAKLEMTLQEQEKHETELSKTSDSLDRRLDKIPPEKLLMEERFAICRQYARAVKLTHLVLQLNNSGLKNTHVATYTYKDPRVNKDEYHCMNQIATVEEGVDGTVQITLSWFDATWFDNGGMLGGYNRAHFGDAIDPVKPQLGKLIRLLYEAELNDEKNAKISKGKAQSL